MQEQLCFNSPVGSETLVYKWPLKRGLDVIATLKCVGEEYPVIDKKLQKLLSEVNSECFKSMSALSEKFNRLVEKIPRQRANKSVLLQKPTASLLKHILDQAYCTAVTDAKKLKILRGSKTYGETHFKTTSEIIEKLDINENDTFFDLGSGIGNVVLQVAGSVKCKLSMGIELTDITSRYAKNMDLEFQKLVNWFGKSTSPYSLIKGDFLSFKEIIKSATIIFVNNFVFPPDLNCELETLFSNLKDSTRIVSTLQFGIDALTINDRNSNSLASILQQKNKVTGPVSWSATDAVFYIEVIDRTSLNMFLANKLQREKKKRIPKRTRKDLTNEESNSCEVESVGLEICYKCTEKNQQLDLAKLEQEKADNKLKVLESQVLQTIVEFKKMKFDFHNLQKKLALSESKLKNLQDDPCLGELSEQRQNIASAPEKYADNVLSNSNSRHSNVQSNLSDLPTCSQNEPQIIPSINIRNTTINQKNKLVHGIQSNLPPVCVCGKPFATLTKLKKHIIHHTGPKNFVCEHCSQCFYGRSLLRRHLKDKHNKSLEKLNNYACRHCLKVLPSQVELKRHHRLIHMEEKKSLNKGSRTIDHKAQPFEEGHKCTCTRSFKSLQRLRAHVSYYKCKTKQVTCVFCDQEFGANSELDEHLKQEHNIIY